MTTDKNECLLKTIKTQIEAYGDEHGLNGYRYIASELDIGGNNPTKQLHQILSHKSDKPFHHKTYKAILSALDQEQRMAIIREDFRCFGLKPVPTGCDTSETIAKGVQDTSNLVLIEFSDVIKVNTIASSDGQYSDEELHEMKREAAEAEAALARHIQKLDDEIRRREGGES